MTAFTDTSNHDILDRNGGRNLDWAAMRRDGIQGGWHKVADGLNFYADPTAAMALAGMRANLDIWGGYHVLWGSRSITGQLDWFASILDRIAAGWRTDPRFVAVWDCEPFSYNTAPTVAQVNEAGDYWLKLTGRKSGGYCPPWHYGGALDGLRYPLISSNYGANPADWYARLYPADTSGRWQATPNKQADVLQYGSLTRQGPHSTMDADAYRGTIAQFIALFNGGSTVAGEADAIFSKPYTGYEPWINGQSWAAQAIERPLVNANGKLDGLSAAIGQLLAAQGVEQSKIDQLLAKPVASITITAETVTPLAVAIGAVLAQHPDNPLGDADKPAITAALSDFFRSHLGQ